MRHHSFLILLLGVVYPAIAPAQHLGDTKRSLDARFRLRDTARQGWQHHYERVRLFGLRGELNVEMDSGEKVSALRWVSAEQGAAVKRQQSALTMLKKKLGPARYEPVDGVEFWRWDAGGKQYVLSHGRGVLAYQETDPNQHSRFTSSTLPLIHKTAPR